MHFKDEVIGTNQKPRQFIHSYFVKMRDNLIPDCTTTMSVNGTSAAALSVATFKYVVEGFVVPLVSVFGLLGNLLTVLVLNHREVKLKRSLVQILCGLASFDNAFLVATFFMFTMPQLSER